MIETVMLVAIGFLIACLLGLVFAQAFWRRAVRLTSQRIRSAMPLTEAEIRADKDLIRAEFAVKVHQLERELERGRLKSHRQFIEANRRDAEITQLTAEGVRLQSELDEHRNARRVLEQTLNDRLPKLEQRLEEARRLLGARDEEIASLGATAERQAQALAEARGLNAQQGAEMDRLRSALGSHQGRDRGRLSELGLETEFGLRTELETLRARTRDQAGVIARLQGELSRRSGAAGESEVGDGAAAAAPAGSPTAEAEAAGGSAIAALAGLPATSLTRQFRALESRTHEQERLIEKLKAEIAALAAGGEADDGKSVVRESRSVLKARLERARVEIENERQAVQRLKAELAAANERAARQAAQFMEQMRHLTPKTLETPRPPSEVSRLAARAGRAAQPASPAAGVSAEPKPELAAAGGRAIELQRLFFRRGGRAAAEGDARSAAESAMPARGEAEVSIRPAAVMPETPQPAPAPANAIAAATAAADSPVASVTVEESEPPADRKLRLLDRLRNYGET